MLSRREENLSVMALRRDFIRYVKPVKTVAKKAIFYLGGNDQTVHIYLVPLATIKHLNKTYLGKDKATDVLSFGVSPKIVRPKGMPKSLGEIIISPEYIKQHKEDMAFMVVHGLLHLLGYNHLKSSDMIEMQKREKLLMKKLTAKN